MRNALVFPPAASPTYVPLGLATLAATLQPHGDLKLVDANLLVWRHLAAEHPDGDRLIRFVHDESGLFYNQEAYRSHNRIWDQLRVRMNGLGRQAQRYLEKNELESGLESCLRPTVERILETDPELIGFSVMFLDQLNLTLALAKYIRGEEGTRSSRSKIILGGAALHALNATGLLAACPEIDGLVLGEGAAGYQALLRDEPPERVPGLLWRVASGIQLNGPLPEVATPEPGWADFRGLPIGDYFNPSPVLPVVFSKDCAWKRCRFCAHNVSFSGYRKKTVASFVDELQQLQQRHQVDHFYFADQYIGAADLSEIASALIQRGLKIFYQVMCRPVKDYTPERLGLIAQSGCRWISWGIESGSQRLLNLIQKGTLVQDIRTVVHDAHAAGISNLAMMIFGLPTSSDIDLWQTFSLLDDLQCSLDAICASSFVLFQPTWFSKHRHRVGLEVSGAERLLEIGTAAVHSTRLNFREVSRNGCSRPPRGVYEIIEWEKRRPWMKETAFMENLPCEHYLLYSRQAYQDHLTPRHPSSRPA
ncbi:MAG: radical SAM protein [Deltaproteobacteria bacterium]|nr:radical SAM protein [Deltaproteobacteria bacterium]